MTPTEDDLRGALRLLEQRAPDDRPDVETSRARPGWPGVLRLASVAALVLVIAGVAAFIGLRHRDAPVTDQAGRTPRPRASTPHTGPPPGLASLRVRVTITGGPVKPNGKPAVVHRPEPGTEVRVTSATDSTGGAYHSRLTITERTDRHGIATFLLPPGRYRYRSHTCGAGFGTHQPVRLRAGKVESVAIDCAVP